MMENELDIDAIARPSRRTDHEEPNKVGGVRGPLSNSVSVDASQLRHRCKFFECTQRSMIQQEN